MLNSTEYHKRCVFIDYAKRVRSIEEKMRDYEITNGLKIKLCPFPNYDNEIKSKAFKEMKSDYFNKKCKYCDGTLFDTSLRKNINLFKFVFINPSTRNILKSFYNYIDRLPTKMKVNKKCFNDLDSQTQCYFRYYLNLFFCYDFVTILLDNYKNCDNMDQLTCLELLINDLLYLLEVIFK